MTNKAELDIQVNGKEMAGRSMLYLQRPDSNPDNTQIIQEMCQTRKELLKTLYS